MENNKINILNHSAMSFDSNVFIVDFVQSIIMFPTRDDQICHFGQGCSIIPRALLPTTGYPKTMDIRPFETNRVCQTHGMSAYEKKINSKHKYKPIIKGAFKIPPSTF